MLKGMAMGMAEVVPGVSGGTIAFITGIYEKLLSTIALIGPQLIADFKQKGFKYVFDKIDGFWILKLLSGMFAGIIIGVFAITHILEHYPILLWSFFFGLIIASCFYVAKQVKRWNFNSIMALILTTCFSYVVTTIAPTQGNPALWFVFISGVIAISALILPGISGSFMLLIMGMYTIVIPSIKNALKTFELESVFILTAFALGCLTGLMSFARVVSYCFKKYKNTTLAALTGFMIGSLNKIWPWRYPSLGVDELGNYIKLAPKQIVDNFKIISETNVSPEFYNNNIGDSQLLFALTLGFFGFLLIHLADSKVK